MPTSLDDDDNDIQMGFSWFRFNSIQLIRLDCNDEDYVRVNTATSAFARMCSHII